MEAEIFCLRIAWVLWGDREASGSGGRALTILARSADEREAGHLIPCPKPRPKTNSCILASLPLILRSSI